MLIFIIRVSYPDYLKMREGKKKTFLVPTTEIIVLKMSQKLEVMF